MSLPGYITEKSINNVHLYISATIVDRCLFGFFDDID